MKVYISGQITGLSESEYKANFKKGCEEMIKLGYDPISPDEDLNHDHEYLKTLPPFEMWKGYMLTDIDALFDCEAIYMLKNWPHSKGARIERAIAHEMGKQIIYQ